MKTIFLLVAIPALLFSCKKNTTDNSITKSTTNGSFYYPPIASQEWQTMTPESLGWNTVNLPGLYAYLQQQDTRAFLVLMNGKIVLEKYFGQNLQGTAPFDQHSFWYWASAGKTLTSFIVGKAQQEGFLQINHKTSDYLGLGWTSAPQTKESLITVRHQLTMTTGLDDNTGDASNTSASALHYKADAGTRWAYHNAPYTLLQQVVSAATGQPFDQYFDAKLKTRIGMDGRWLANGEDRVYWSTARSMARFGLFMLAKAHWNGNDMLGDTAYYRASLNSSQNRNLAYGYLWWLNGKASYMVPQSALVFTGTATPAAPPDMVAALGKDGQLLNIVPSKGLVLVRMGASVQSGLVSLELQNSIWEKLKAVIK